MPALPTSGELTEPADSSVTCCRSAELMYGAREIGFTHVDCYWKWRELALLVGCKPAAARASTELTVDGNEIDE